MRSPSIASLLSLLIVAGALPAQQPAGSARADTIVRTAGRPLHPGLATAVQEISIGIADGDEHYMIGTVADIAVGANGEVYIYDNSVPAIRMYDAAGKYVKTIGRRGRGPGEYQSGSALAIARDGNLLMWDPGNSRINVYSPTGETVTHWPTLSGTTNESASGQNLLAVDHLGQVTISKTAFIRNAEGRVAGRRKVWIRFAPSGALKDTIDLPPMPENGAILQASSGGSSMAASVPFTGNNPVVLNPMGFFVTGFSNRYAFEIVEPGKPIVSIRRDVPARPVTDAERDAARNEVIRRMRTVDPSWSWSGPEIPKTRPAYTRIRTGLDGRIWLTVAEGPLPDSAANAASGTTVPMSSMGAGRAGGPGRGAGYNCNPSRAATYDVFDPTGVYVGQVQVPARSTVLISRGDFIWASACDEEDVPSVKRYRIKWGG